VIDRLDATEGPVVRLPNPNPSLPFPSAVRVGPWIMLSGEIGIQADGLLAEGLEGQTRQMLQNIEATLARMGADRSHIVRCLVMLRRMEAWTDFNAVYLEFFGDLPLPARSAFGAAGLAMDAEVEIECLAFAP
jgi:enamine deaminase RidA (YjgF/YER057c/UK114 family)